MDSRTSVFNVKTIRQELILLTLSEVIKSLEKAGYNATNQIIGYLLANDETYITNYDNAREKLTQFNRSEVLMAIINSYRGM